MLQLQFPSLILLSNFLLHFLLLHFFIPNNAWGILQLEDSRSTDVILSAEGKDLSLLRAIGLEKFVQQMSLWNATTIPRPGLSRVYHTLFHQVQGGPLQVSRLGHQVARHCSPKLIGQLAGNLWTMNRYIQQGKGYDRTRMKNRLCAWMDKDEGFNSSVEQLGKQVQALKEHVASGSLEATELAAATKKIQTDDPNKNSSDNIDSAKNYFCSALVDGAIEGDGSLVLKLLTTWASQNIHSPEMVQEFYEGVEEGAGAKDAQQLFSFPDKARALLHLPRSWREVAGGSSPHTEGTGGDGEVSSGESKASGGIESSGAEGVGGAGGAGSGESSGTIGTLSDSSASGVSSAIENPLSIDTANFEQAAFITIQQGRKHDIEFLLIKDGVVGTPESYPDCGESTFRNFFNLLLYQKNTQSFDVSFLRHLLAKSMAIPPEGFAIKLQELIDFYTDYPTLYLQNQQDVRERWAKIMSSLPGVFYEKSGGKELDSIGNPTDKIIKVLTGIDNLPELFAEANTFYAYPPQQQFKFLKKTSASSLDYEVMEMHGHAWQIKKGSRHFAFEKHVDGPPSYATEPPVPPLTELLWENLPPGPLDEERLLLLWNSPGARMPHVTAALMRPGPWSSPWKHFAPLLWSNALRGTEKSTLLNKILLMPMQMDPIHYWELLLPQILSGVTEPFTVRNYLLHMLKSTLATAPPTLIHQWEQQILPLLLRESKDIFNPASFSSIKIEDLIEHNIRSLQLVRHLLSKRPSFRPDTILRVLQQTPPVLEFLAYVSQYCLSLQAAEARFDFSIRMELRYFFATNPESLLPDCIPFYKRPDAAVAVADSSTRATAVHPHVAHHSHIAPIAPPPPIQNYPTYSPMIYPFTKLTELPALASIHHPIIWENTLQKIVHTPLAVWKTCPDVLATTPDAASSSVSSDISNSCASESKSPFSPLLPKEFDPSALAAMSSPPPLDTCPTFISYWWQALQLFPPTSISAWRHHVLFLTNLLNHPAGSLLESYWGQPHFLQKLIDLPIELNAPLLTQIQDMGKDRLPPPLVALICHMHTPRSSIQHLQQHTLGCP